MCGIPRRRLEPALNSHPPPVTARGWRPGRYEGPETASDLAQRTGRGIPGTGMCRFAFWYAGPTNVQARRQWGCFARSQPWSTRGFLPGETALA